MVSDEIIAGVLQTADGAQNAADRLIELARGAGGLDNITAICVRCEISCFLRQKQVAKHEKWTASIQK